MNPLSVWTFCRRHKSRAALLLAFASIVTAGLYLMVALSWAIFVEPMRLNRMFLLKFAVVMPSSDEAAQIMAVVRIHPDVARVIPVIFGQGISVPQMIGEGEDWFNLLALREEDLPYVMERCGATLKEGDLLQPGTNGLMLSEQVAASLDLQVGDIIHNSVDPDRYSNILEPMKVVGILQSDMRLGLISYEYMRDHELYRAIPTRFLVVPQEGREDAVERFLRNEIRTPRTEVWTLPWLTEQMEREYASSYTLLVPIALLVALAMTLVIGVVNRIAFSRRLPEFGILYAMGHGKKELTRRLTIETAALAVSGWLIGIGLSWGILYGLRLAVFAPRGYDLAVIVWAPAALAALVPLAVTASTRLSAGRAFSRLDAVAVVERGELGPEERRLRPTAARHSRSSLKPLASWTFYRRHKLRAVSLTSAMALMIMAVVLAVFVFAAMRDAPGAKLGDLRRMSSVGSPPGVPLDPALVTLLRTHPTVERVIPYDQMTLLDIIIPPLGGETINPYGVYAEDMEYLVALYGLKLKEGHLPRPRSNELVLPEAVAQNRDLQVGDVLGDPEHPAYPGAPSLPVEFVVAGIFAWPAEAEDENWLAFYSLEFWESHESLGGSGQPLLPLSLLIVPKAGQKEALDDWLENEVESSSVWVSTYHRAEAYTQENLRTQLLTLALLESVIAVVAAVALATLNHISVSQRRSEFGLLHALGHSRLWLVWRAVRETIFTTGAAWILTAVLCLAGLLYLQFGVFAPLGLRLNLFNLTPWLFTLPIPAAVLVATTATVGRALAKLDPVSIIEERQG